MKAKIVNFMGKALRYLKLAWFYVSKFSGLKWLWKQYKRLSNRKRKMIIGYLFISPYLVGLVILGLRPLISSLRMSFADTAAYVYNQEKQIVEFIVKGFGLKQYFSLFKNNPEHVTTIVSFLRDIALVVPIVLVFSLILALMLNQKLPGRGIFRVIFFIPVILLSGSMIRNFNTYGLLTVPAIVNNAITESISFYFPDFIATIIIGTFDRVVLFLWLSGVQTLIFLAGLQKMDSQIYEAASIDGASLWESFWKITLPQLIPLMFINIIYTTVIYSNLSNNPIIGLINSTMVDVKFGRAYASMLAWVLFLIELAIILVYSGIVKLASRRYN